MAYDHLQASSADAVTQIQPSHDLPPHPPGWVDAGTDCEGPRDEPRGGFLRNPDRRLTPHQGMGVHPASARRDRVVAAEVRDRKEADPACSSSGSRGGQVSE